MSMILSASGHNLAHDELVRNERLYGCCQGLSNREGGMESPPLADSCDSYKIKLLHQKCGSGTHSYLLLGYDLATNAWTDMLLSDPPARPFGWREFRA
jgi:hypothetical protein